MSKTNMTAVRHREAASSYLMLSPYLILLAAFVIYPIFWVMRYCLYKYTGFIKPIYVGFSNFQKVFADTNYWHSIINVFAFAFGKLLIELPLALVLAYILSENLSGKNFFRTIYFLPSMLSIAIIGVMFKYIFSAYKGVTNEIMLALKITEFFGNKMPIDWFSTWFLAMCVLAVASIWSAFGLNMLFFMTGLQSIPKELYESAIIDGANNSKKFFYITIPMLAPVTQMVVMNALLATLKTADLVLVLTDGAPSGSTEFMMSYIYKKFFPSGGSGGAASNYGVASAMVIVSAVLLCLVAVFYLRLTRRSEELY